MTSLHTNFTSRRSGLIISNLCNVFAVTPDAICYGSCCGTYVLEIKCPCILEPTDSTMEALLNLKKPYIMRQNNEYFLNRAHEYYYQIQMQMAVCGCDFGYFYVWSKNLTINLRVEFDAQFWNENNVKAFRFVKSVIIPELMNSHFTKTY